MQSCLVQSHHVFSLLAGTTDGWAVATSLSALTHLAFSPSISGAVPALTGATALQTISLRNNLAMIVSRLAAVAVAEVVQFLWS